MQFSYINPNHYVRPLEGTARQRLREAKRWRSESPRWWPFGPCGAYHFSFNANDKGQGFYLGDELLWSLRWEWCDVVIRSIRHTGWFTDEYQSETIRGVVFRLPHGRGFLAGWSMGEGMASAVDRYVWDDEKDAARAADDMAERAAERAAEREEAANEDGD